MDVDVAKWSVIVTGEQLLMLAVLENAIWTYQRYAFADDRRGIALMSQVEEWFASEDAEWTYSFVTICEHLGLEASCVRAGLRQLRDCAGAASGAGDSVHRRSFRRVSARRQRATRRTGNDRGVRPSSARMPTAR